MYVRHDHCSGRVSHRELTARSRSYAIGMWPEHCRGSERAHTCIVDAHCLRADCRVADGDLAGC